MTWDSSRTVVIIKLLLTSALWDSECQCDSIETLVDYI